MVYCRSCGEEIHEADNYCPSCGTQTAPDQNYRSVDEQADQFIELFEGMIDGEIERIAESDVDVSPFLLDQFTFAFKMYIIGLMKGYMTLLLLSGVKDTDNSDVLETDFSPFYEWIVDTVEEREDRIREALEEETETG